MKRPFLILMNLVCICLSQTRAQDTTWLDMAKQETAAGDAIYYRTKTVTDSGWQVTDRFLSHRIEMKGTYLDEPCNIATGEFTWFDEKGNPTRFCNYIRGRPEGKEIVYYDNGQVQAEGMNNAGIMDGEWTGYYPSGAVSARALYKDSLQVSASFFHEDGTTDTTKAIFIRTAAFPGGDSALYQFLEKKLKYPKKAAIFGIMGQVLIKFLVRKDGKIANLKVCKSVEVSLDTEAYRVISTMPDWEPAIVGGLTVESLHILPVVFEFRRDNPR